MIDIRGISGTHFSVWGQRGQDINNILKFISRCQKELRDGNSPEILLDKNILG
jgi:hypothetical protein